MTLEELKALIDGVELRNFPYRVMIRTEIRHWCEFYLVGRLGETMTTSPERRIRGIIIHFEQYIPDRETGVIGKISTQFGLQESMVEDFNGSETDALDLFVRRKLEEMVTHEVSEALHYKGDRIFDPHGR